MKMLVTKNPYEQWARDHFVRYASTTVKGRGGFMHNLVFGVFVAGGYMVMHGLDVLYEGPSFDAAAEAYNDAV